MTKHKIINNFLTIDFFEKVKNYIMDQDFPWRRRDHMVSSTNDPMYFTHCFYNNMLSYSNIFESHMIPILKKLETAAPIEVRANMMISVIFQKGSWHRDREFKCKTAILYLNDCDGGTDLKINNETIFIKADANKMVVFDTDVFHRSVTSKKEPARYILNFNYFT